MIQGRAVDALETLKKRSGSGNEQAEVTISFTAEVYGMLKEIASKRNISVTDVIEEAIGLEKWYQRTLEEGGKMMVEGKDGQVWEFKSGQP